MAIEELKFLGLGSMVEVEDMDALKDTKYVVIARAVGKNSNDATVLRYMLAPHPFGDVPKQKDNILIVTDNQITKIHVEGYVDIKDDQFLEELLGNLSQTVSRENTTTTKISTNQASEDEEENKKSELLAQEQVERDEAKRVAYEKEQLRRDPFYKFRKKVEE